MATVAAFAPRDGGRRNYGSPTPAPRIVLLVGGGRGAFVALGGVEQHPHTSSHTQLRGALREHWRSVVDGTRRSAHTAHPRKYGGLRLGLQHYAPEGSQGSPLLCGALLCWALYATLWLAPRNRTPRYGLRYGATHQHTLRKTPRRIECHCIYSNGRP